jgi:hypothetical protein
VVQDPIGDAVDHVGDIRDGRVARVATTRVAPHRSPEYFTSLLNDSDLSPFEPEIHGKVEHEDDTYEHKADHESIIRVHG